MTTQEILDTLADKVGKPLARMATPSYWRYEDRGRAARYERSLFAAREAYRQIRGGADPVATLKALGRVVRTGIEMNWIRSMIYDICGEDIYLSRSR